MMSRRFAVVCARAILLTGWLSAGAEWAGAADWPRFRGPNGAGASNEPGVPVEIGDEHNQIWKAAIPGKGHSSPIVSKQRVFLQTATDEGNARLMLCLDLSDGKPLWSRLAPGTTSKTHPKNTLASCTAAADGKRVYMPFWDGTHLSVTAYDYEGNEIWNRNLGTFTSQHGAGHSPVVVQDKVIVANDQDGSSEVVALNAATGEVSWRVPRPAHRTCYSTPLLLERSAGDPEVLVGSTFGITAYDPADGSVRWTWQWETNDRKLRTVGSPVVSQGYAFLSSGDGSGVRHAVAVNLHAEKDRISPALEWETRKTLLPYVPCMLTRGEYLYFVNDAGLAGCYAAKTGKEVWTKRLEIGDVTASPVMAEGRIYVVSEKGSAFVLAAEPEFKELATADLGEGVKASPALADGRLLVRGEQHLFCFGTPGK